MVVQNAKCSIYDKSPACKYNIHHDKAQHRIKIMTDKIIFSKAYLRQEARCLLQSFCTMELKRNVRKFLFSSTYVTAAITGHMMNLLVHKVDRQ